MSRRNIFCFLIILLLFPGPSPEVSGQEVWSLERCIEYALENNIVIRQQELSTQVNENLLQQSRIARLPSLNANTQQNLSYGRTLDFFTNTYIDRNTYSFSYNASTQMTLFNGFQITNTIRQDNLNLMASLAELDRLKNNISLNIASAYLQILFSKELLSIAENQLEISGQQVERTRRLVDAGSLPMGNLLEIQAQQAGDNLRVVNATNQLTLAYLALTQLLELPAVEGFAIEIPDFEEVPVVSPQYRVESVFAAALDVQPQVRGSELQVEASEVGLDIARGRRSPRLFLSASHGSGYQDLISEPPAGWGDYTAPAFRDQIRNNQSSTFAMGLAIPIFNAGQVNTAIANARIGVLNSQYNLQRTRNQLYQEIQQSFADAVAAYENYRATEVALESIEESFRHMEQRFEVGMVTTVEFNQALNQLSVTRSELLRAKYEYIFMSAVLDFYMGERIRL
jgi:outer membrane protein